jgi:glycosyltransferase involved in cell wall biosynthesis
MKVVIVNEGLAYPPTAGNWIRTINLMLHLAKRHEIIYVCRGVDDSDAMRRAVEFYRENGIRAIVVGDPPPAKSGLAFYGRLAANLLSPLPYSIATHNSPAVRQEIRRLAATESIDVWQFEVPSYADALAGTDARTIIMAHNVESLIWKRLYETERQPLKRWYIGQQWKKYERFETTSMSLATRVVAVSEEDAALFRSRFGIENPAVVDNGVDLAFFAEGSDRTGFNPKQILFLGSLEWRPNVDSLDLLLDQILPEVLAQEPEARLCIVGRNPSPGLLRRAEANPSVELHADVPDVRPYLARSGVMAVPLRIGGGSRLKILEAIAAGLPVVSSRVGCEGLSFQPDRDLLVVERPEEMAAALLRCIRDPAGAAEMGARGREVAHERYDWSQLAGRLESIWYECAGDPVVAKPVARSTHGANS